MSESGDNREQIDYWNGTAGLSWVSAQDRLDRMLAPISAVLLDRADVRAGQRVVDVGCGCGDTAIALAASGAAVWGIDVSEPMLERARRRAGAHVGLGPLVFTRTDAATQAFTPDHDLVMSRFGVMFFADPRAAFANLGTALAPGGRLCFVCWQAPQQNPWVAVPGKAVQPFLAPPQEAPDPRAPGPFAFADADYLTDTLEQAGFGGITVESMTPTLHVADDLDSALEYFALVGPLSRALAEMDEPSQRAALDAVREALTPYLTPRGLDLGSACWLVSAGVT